MTTTAKAASQQALAPPRGAAIAGVIFSVLMIVCLGLVRYAIPADLTIPDPWLVEPDRRRAVGLALDLVPFDALLVHARSQIARARADYELFSKMS